jgi:tetratricopeptide (TPR) repeat protein
VFGACFLIALLPNAELAARPDLSERELLERAESAFEEGARLRLEADKARPHFREATNDFDELRRRGVHNALLYRNLGHAYLLAGDLPRAILSYQRGLRLAPNDFALRQALAEARERVVYPASGSLGRPRDDSRPPWLPIPRAEWLLVGAGLCYVVACAALTRWLMVRHARLLGVALFSVMLAMGLAAWLLVRVQEERERDEHPLVVIAQDGVLLRRGNGPAFPPRYIQPVNRGVEARRLFERDGWVQIELSGGEIGWVPRDAVLVDHP